MQAQIIVHTVSGDVVLYVDIGEVQYTEVATVNIVDGETKEWKGEPKMIDRQKLCVNRLPKAHVILAAFPPY